jgi:MFS transporter, DHA1 family, inner membrane transport protein
MPPALPSVRADLGATLHQGGWLLSIINLLAASTGMLVALTADRIGHRRLIIVGTGVCLATSLAGACADDVVQLLVARFFEGLGFIATTVAVPALLVRMARSNDSRRVMALWSIYMPFGAGSMMLVAALILPHASWRAVWLVAGAASAAMLAVLLLRTLPRRELDPIDMTARPVISEMMEVVTSPGPLALAICFGAYSSCWYAVVGFLPTLQIDRLGFTPFAAAIVTAFVTFVNVGGNLAAGALLRRGVPRVVLIVGASVSMGFCAAGIFVDGVPDLVRLILAAIYSMVIGAVAASLFAAVPVHAPRPQLVGAATGLLMQGSNIGALVGPPITAMLVTSGGWPAAVTLTSSALACVALAGLFLHHRERRKLEA